MSQSPGAPSNPFIGLRPFTAVDAPLFFGRTRQVDDLLSLMQSQKLISVVGPAWSGKTSLIQAGLIPALHAGHHGAAGTKWTVCQTRPGLNPLRNLAFALAGEGALHPGLAPTPDEADRYELILRHDNSGLFELYRNSPLAGKKNLLIHIDQMEDLFRYQDLYEDQQKDDIQVFFDNILKATSEKGSAVYVLLTLRSEHMGQLFPYRRLQEEMAQGQFLMPRLRKQEIREMAAGPAAALGVPLSEEVINWVVKEGGSEPSRLANIQFLMYESVRHKGTPSAVTAEDVQALGGVSDIFSHALEEIISQSDEASRHVTEHLFRTITLAGGSGEISQPANFGRIRQLLDCTPQDLSQILGEFMKPGAIFLDQVPAVIQHVARPPDAAWEDLDVVNLGNESVFRSWPEFEKWIQDERESRDHYLFLVESAGRYEAGTAGLLKPPELNIAQKWYSDEQPGKAWAQRYHPDYDKAIHFLRTSEDAYNAEVLARENEQKRKIRAIRKRMVTVAAAALLIIAVMSVLFTRAQQARYEAQKQKENADVAQQIALKQAESAREAQKLAESEANRANQAVDRAEEEYQKAEAAREKAEDARRQTQQALVLEEQAKQQAELAKEQAEKANAQRAQALELEKIAKQKADDRETLMRILRDFYVLENQLNSQGPSEALVNQIAETYKSYEEYSTKVNGTVLPNNQLQHLLGAVEQSLQAEGKAIESAENVFLLRQVGLRSLAVSPNGSVLTGGDKEQAWFIKDSTSTPIQVGDRIRSVLFVTDHQMFAGTFTGGIVTALLPDGKPKNIIAPTKKDPDPVFYLSTLSGGQEVLAVTARMLYILTAGGEIKTRIKAPDTLISAVWSDSLATGYVGTKTSLYHFDGTALKKLEALDTLISGKAITALALNDSFVACGLRSSPILLFDRKDLEAAAKRVNPISLVHRFIEHKSEVTSLLFDKSRPLLYSASLDQTIKVYDLGLPSDKVENTIVTLQGHKKWVWALAQSIRKDGVHVLLTADEGGNVFKWVYGVEAQLADIQGAFSQTNSQK